jgi:c-di-GMP-binding flagellar brake protein YcgR
MKEMSMQSNQAVPEHLLVMEKEVERRSKSRIYAPFPATVRGVDESGMVFQSKTTIDNISTGGLYLRVMQRLEPRTKLYIIVHISNVQIDGEPVLRLHLGGDVLRVEPRLGGATGLAVMIKNNRLF